MMHTFGLAVYRFGNEDGTLLAEWTGDAASAPQKELGYGLAKPVSGSPDKFEGEYNVEYWNNGEVSHKNLTISKNGTVFHMEWRCGQDVTHTGYGFVSGDVLVSGFCDCMRN